MTEELYDPVETKSAFTASDALLRELPHRIPNVRALPDFSLS